MAAYFELIDKVTNKPVIINNVDELFCQHFNSNLDQDIYGGRGKNSFNWFDRLFFYISIDNISLDKAKEYFIKKYEEKGKSFSEHEKYLDFFIKRYTVKTW